MVRRTTFAVLILLLCVSSYPQVSYLNRPNLLAQVDSCLQHTYNFSFFRAREIQEDLLNLTPTHPAPLFLEALIVYWENFPLLPKDKASEKFVDLMNRVIHMAEGYIDKEDLHLEGVFFDLFGRAFKAMYWADNGKAGKLVPDLRTMYKHTREGMELKDQFSEFYFSTGLYNYYIEAYPEAHPVYKPMLSFMKKGDKTLGLKQLNLAISHSIFLKVESMLFMSLIQLNYEDDLNTASIYADRLNRDYPHNIYYQGHLVTILLHQHRYKQVNQVLESMRLQNDTYSSMIRLMANAFMAEKKDGDSRQAGIDYRKTIELADSFGSFANQFKAIAFMGLSRLHNKKDLPGEARRYARKASSLTAYKFILEE